MPKAPQVKSESKQKLTPSYGFDRNFRSFFDRNSRFLSFRGYCMKEVTFLTEKLFTFRLGHASYKSQVSMLRNLELGGYCQYQYIDLYLFS